LLHGNSSVAPRAPLNLNLLTFYLIVLLVPFEFILDYLGGSSPSASPGNVLETTLLAFAFTYFGAPKPRHIRLFGVRFLAMLWFGLGAAGILVLVRNQISRPSGEAIEMLCLLGAGALLIRGLWYATPRYRTLLAFLGATLFPWLFMTTSVDLMVGAIHHLPDVYDPVLYRIDGILGLNWVAVFADILRQHASLSHIVLFNYYYIALWGLLAAVSQAFTTPPNRAYLLLCSFMLGIFGFCLYYLMPAIDPLAYFGAAFPDHLPAPQGLPVHQILTHSQAFRNTMPSLHTASGLLMYLAVRQSPIWHRLIAIVVVACILVSTLALGEHYAVDLIAAFPLVLLVRGLCAPYLPLVQPARLHAILAGAALTGLWILAVRCGPVSLELPNLIRALALLSLAAPILLERRLAQAEQA
jgi:hypothetical protein